MNHLISLEKAVQMTTRYRNQKESMLAEGYQNRNILPLSETFDRKAFDKLLSQDGCTGIRIYYGMNEDNQVHAILVGVDAENRDQLPAASALSEEPEDADPSIVELGLRCPSDCPPPSDLNP